MMPGRSSSTSSRGRSPTRSGLGSGSAFVLVSADFSKEVLTTVLWLNEHDLDIRCVRFKPYELGDRVVIDAEQIVPRPREAEEYQIHVREKTERERLARRQRQEETWTGKWYVNIDDGTWDDCRRYGLVAAGGGPRYIDPLKKLGPGDKVYVNQRQYGYVGFGKGG